MQLYQFMQLLTTQRKMPPPTLIFEMKLYWPLYIKKNTGLEWFADGFHAGRSLCFTISESIWKLEFFQVEGIKNILLFPKISRNSMLFKLSSKGSVGPGDSSLLGWLYSMALIPFSKFDTLLDRETRRRHYVTLSGLKKRILVIFSTII